MITLIAPQFERENEFLVNPHLPSNDNEFYEILADSDINALVEMGFAKWQLMNEIVRENQSRSVTKIINIPIINAPGKMLTMDIGRKDAPTVLLAIDKMIMLFPGEWYGLIPNGFMVTGLSGNERPFERGVSDDDIRFGCLPYGIQKDI